MNTEMESVTTDAAITQLYDTWQEAVRKQDLDTILQCYTDGVVAFDAILALQFQGKEAYRKHWQACLDMCPAKGKTPIFRMRDLTVNAAGDIAFAHALVQCGFEDGDHIEASWMRMSAGLQRQGGKWRIAHEHFSAPFEMPSGKAMFHLSPDDTEDQVRAIPPGVPTVSAHLVCADAPAAMAFYKKAFNAMQFPGGRFEVDGTFLHGTLFIGDSMVMIAQENESCGMASPLALKGTPVTLHVYVPDVDSAFRRAIDAGAKEIMPVSDMFWGDRYGVVEDPFGHRWSLATHVRDLTPEQIEEGARQFCS